MFEPILDHQAQALKRLVTRFQTSVLVNKLVASFMPAIQELEQMFVDLGTMRTLANAQGVNLDNLGTLIGLARSPGDDDDTYRRKLYAEVKVNTSQGQPEQLIQVFQLFTAAQMVLLFEEFPGEFIVDSEYLPPDQDTANLLLVILKKVAAAGVRPAMLVSFDAVDSFAYAGSLPGQGYGTVSDASVGGKYPQIFTYTVPFAYAGGDATALGYSSVSDGLVGGAYAS